MIKDAYIEEIYLVFSILFVIFVLVKIYGLVIYKIKKQRYFIFLNSVKIYSRQEIRNTFDRKNLYYIFSNKVNLIFYTLFILNIGFWLIMNCL